MKYNNDYIDLFEIASTKTSSNETSPAKKTAEITQTAKGNMKTLDWDALPEPYQPPEPPVVKPQAHPEYVITKPKNEQTGGPNPPTILAGFVNLTKPAMTSTITDYSSWDILPEEPIYHDVPDEDTLREQDAEDAVANLLKPSNKLLEKIKDYLENKDVKKLPIEEADTTQYTEVQKFTYKDKIYILDDEEVLKEVYVMMLQLEHPMVQRHTLNRRPNLLKNLENLLPLDDSFKEDIILNTLPKEFIITQITKALSFMISNTLLTEQDPKLTFRKETVASNLGKMLLESFITLQYQYITITDYKTNEDLREGIVFADKLGVYKFTKRNPSDILKILLSLHEKNDDYLKYANMVPISPELREVVQYSLIDYCEKVIPPIIIPFKFDAESLEKRLVIYTTKLGLTVITWLKTVGLFREVVDAKQVPRLVYELEHAVDLLAASSFYKPQISTTKFPTVYSTKIGDKISLTLDLKTEPVKNSKEVKLDARPELIDLLESYKNMPMSVDSEQFSYFIKLLSLMLVKSDVSAEDKLTVAFLNTLYDIDFALMKNNNTNKELVEKLAKFGLDFNNAFDKNLQQACGGNLACNNAYNVISSYKFYIKGFLGELNLYIHLMFIS